MSLHEEKYHHEHADKLPRNKVGDTQLSSEPTDEDLSNDHTINDQDLSNGEEADMDGIVAPNLRPITEVHSSIVQPEEEFESGEVLGNSRSDDVDVLSGTQHIKREVAPESDLHVTSEGVHVQCPLCSTSFSSAQSFIVHIKVYHGETNFYQNEKFGCSCCSHKKSRLTTQQKLDTTSSIRIVKKELKCSKCPYTTSVLSRLKNHERMHAGKNRYKCLACPFATLEKSTLVEHQKTHSQILGGPLKCTVCSYSTSVQSQLITHQASHADGIPLKCRVQCPVCPYNTFSRASFDKHQLEHALERPFQCSHCPFATSRYYNLAKHQKRYHGRSSDSEFYDTKTGSS